MSDVAGDKGDTQCLPFPKLYSDESSDRGTVHVFVWLQLLEAMGMVYNDDDGDAQ